MRINNVLKNRDCIYGFLALWIIVYHVYLRIGVPFSNLGLGNFLAYGNLSVDIFLFLSGFCIYLSFDKKPEDIKGFLKKRLVRVLIPYLLLATPYWIWACLVESPGPSGGFYVKLFLADFFSATFWLKGLTTTWFVFAILLFYLGFPILYKVIRGGYRNCILCILGVLFFLILLVLFVPYHKYSVNFWGRIPIFCIGAMAAKYREKLDFTGWNRFLRRLFVGASFLLLALELIAMPARSLVTVFDVRLYVYLLHIPYILFALVVLMAFLGYVQEHEKERLVIGLQKIFCLPVRFLVHMGQMSLELYLIHVCVYHVARYYGITEPMGYWLYLFLPAAAILLAELYWRMKGMCIRLRNR